MKNTFFITATGTEIGKTLLTCALTWQLRALGKSVLAVKPVISGFDEKDVSCDTARLLQAMEKPFVPAEINTISPWRFIAPRSPHFVALEPINCKALTAWCTGMWQAENTLLIEGAGGAMAPLSYQHTVLDWMQALAVPAIVVTGNYLGAISHTLTTLSALKSAGIPLQAVVVSESVVPAASWQEMQATLTAFTPAGTSIYYLPRLANGATNYKDAPPLTEMLERDATLDR